jgi:hypothetical protein
VVDNNNVLTVEGDGNDIFTCEYFARIDRHRRRVSNTDRYVFG